MPLLGFKVRFNSIVGLYSLTSKKISASLMCSSTSGLSRLEFGHVCDCRKYYYRPQRSCGKVMFLHLSVILSRGGQGVCHTHPWADTPWADTPSPWADTLPGQRPLARHPLGIHPPGHTPPGQTPPGQCMLGYGQQAGGTHPTGMQSWYKLFQTLKV